MQLLSLQHSRTKGAVKSRDDLGLLFPGDSFKLLQTMQKCIADLGGQLGILFELLGS